jgi:hypothetical protein
MNMMEVDGYKAMIEYDPELDQFRGEILGLNGSADFYGTSPASLRREFKNSLKVYLGACRTWHRNSSRQGHPVKNHALFLGHEDNLRLFSAGTTFPLNFSSPQGMHSFQIPPNTDQTPFTLNGI